MADPDPASMYIYLVCFLLSLLITALFHGCDEAFFAIGETRLRELADAGNHKAKKIAAYMRKERRFTTRIRLNTLLCSVIATIGFTTLTPSFSAWLSDLLGVKPNSFTSK